MKEQIENANCASDRAPSIPSITATTSTFCEDSPIQTPKRKRSELPRLTHEFSGASDGDDPRAIKAARTPSHPAERSPANRNNPHPTASRGYTDVGTIKRHLKNASDRVSKQKELLDQFPESLTTAITDPHNNKELYETADDASNLHVNNEQQRGFDFNAVAETHELSDDWAEWEEWQAPDDVVDFRLPNEDQNSLDNRASSKIVSHDVTEEEPQNGFNHLTMRSSSLGPDFFGRAHSQPLQQHTYGQYQQPNATDIISQQAPFHLAYHHSPQEISNPNPPRLFEDQQEAMNSFQETPSVPYYQISHPPRLPPSQTDQRPREFIENPAISLETLERFISKEKFDNIMNLIKAGCTDSLVKAVQDSADDLLRLVQCCRMLLVE